MVTVIVPAFADAAYWFLALTGGVGERWQEPGLGDWNVRDLVGHTSRSLLTVESYLGVPAQTVQVASAAAYYLALTGVDGEVVTERGR